MNRWRLLETGQFEEKAQKRLALAAAIAPGCPWLILDEPSLSQDADNTLAMSALIRGLARAGTGVFLISSPRRPLRAAARV